MKQARDLKAWNLEGNECVSWSDWGSPLPHIVSLQSWPLLKYFQVLGCGVLVCVHACMCRSVCRYMLVGVGT